MGYVQPAKGTTAAQQRYAAIRWTKISKQEVVLKNNEEELDKLSEETQEESTLCCVCLDKAVSCKLFPCEHAQFCMECIVENLCRWCQRDSPGEASCATVCRKDQVTHTRARAHTNTHARTHTHVCVCVCLTSSAGANGEAPCATVCCKEQVTHTHTQHTSTAGANVILPGEASCATGF